MADKETLKKLETKYPQKTFEELLEKKMKEKHLSKQEALEDILRTATKTNADINKEFGL